MSTAAFAELVGGRLEGEPNAMLLGAEVDSRRLEPGDLFVALEGARVDGHRFVDQALGVATAALVREGVELSPPPPGTSLIRVGDPLGASQRAATELRRQSDWTVLALTGSVAKTTTKEILADLLEASFCTGRSTGNRNSTLGLPVEILSQEPELQMLVVEAGMSHPGELAELSAIIEPDLVVFTRLAAAHTEFLGGIDGVIEAKAELLERLRAGGTIVLNGDDPHQATLADRRPDARCLRYGVNEEHRVDEIESNGLLGSRFTLILGEHRCDIELPLAGAHQIENLLAAATAAVAVGLDHRQIPAAAARLTPAPHRGEILNLASGATLIDDSYNASPEAMRRMLELLASTPGRRLAVLGEMYELGDIAAEAHAEIGRQAAECADLVIAVGGELADLLAESASAARVLRAADAEAAAAILEVELGLDDVALIKASRGIALDRTVELLTGGDAC